jgi:hypothetical protein
MTVLLLSRDKFFEAHPDTLHKSSEEIKELYEKSISSKEVDKNGPVE